MVFIERKTLFQFGEGELVALREDYSELGLRVGDTGVIWAFYNTMPPAYEVTFKGEDGEPFDMTMSEDELVAVPEARELSLAGNAEASGRG